MATMLLNLQTHALFAQSALTAQKARGFQQLVQLVIIVLLQALHLALSVRQATTALQVPLGRIDVISVNTPFKDSLHALTVLLGSTALIKKYSQ